MYRPVSIGLLIWLTLPNVASAGDPRAVFEQRIMPIFRSPKPSSCVQCHLAEVDLKDYIRPSSEQTFVSLRDQGLIDLDKPKESKILRLIRMGDEDRRPASLIHADTRRAEYEAFADWVESCCADANLRNAPALFGGDKPRRSPELIRHARNDRLLESFERNVWAWRFRCMNCHTEGTPQNDKFRKEHGVRVAWVKKDGAAATMEYLIASKLIDVKEPDKSLLLQKPLMQVDHGGGIKFVPGDQGYKGFRTWIEDVAAIRGGRYTSASDLPPKENGPLRFGTDIWLRLAETPPEWADKLVQVNLFAWDEAKKAWEPEPIATSDRKVWGKGKMWQHNLTLLAAAGSPRAKVWTAGEPTLPPGKYRVTVYLDREDRLAHDWKATLGENNFVGAAEFTPQWAPGNDRITVVPASRVFR